MPRDADHFSNTLSLIQERAPLLAHSRALALAAIWDQVVDRLVKAMLDLENGVERELHINLKAEMSFEIARLMHFFAKSVVEKRANARDLNKIDLEVETEECLGPRGEEMIRNTAKMAHERIWDRLMAERWQPKSRKAIEREKNAPRSAALSVSPVRDKHFISRWFIRDYWADGAKATRWRWSEGDLKRDEILFGAWGHRVGLWDDRIEAYFGLLENDGKRPVQMLLDTIPLNPPQQEAFVAYVVIHMLRSPQFVLGLRQQLQEMLDEAARDAGVPFDEMARRAYASLFRQNKIYDAWARPILWSRWAIVTSEKPLFVLPDTFCARSAADGEAKIIVPLTPTKCFVTLPSKEEEKRVVPFHIAADPALARQISNLLIASADIDFLAHRDYTPPETPTVLAFAEVLDALEHSLNDRT